MNLLLNRDVLGDDFTLGKLSIDGKFFCYTVEDKVREKKIPAVTAIPYGTYKVSLTMSNRFKKILPLLHDVPEFTGVRIHSGNTAADSEGCIIVGLERHSKGVLRSRSAMDALMDVLQKARDMEIEIV